MATTRACCTHGSAATVCSVVFLPPSLSATISAATHGLNSKLQKVCALLTVQLISINLRQCRQSQWCAALCSCHPACPPPALQLCSVQMQYRQQHKVKMHLIKSMCNRQPPWSQTRHRACLLPSQQAAACSRFQSCSLSRTEISSGIGCRQLGVLSQQGSRLRLQVTRPRCTQNPKP